MSAREGRSQIAGHPPLGLPRGLPSAPHMGATNLCSRNARGATNGPSLIGSLIGASIREECPPGESGAGAGRRGPCTLACYHQTVLNPFRFTTYGHFFFLEISLPAPSAIRFWLCQ